MENGERKKEKEDMGHAHKKRSALQKEIDNRGKDLEKKQKRRRQRELLIPWRDAADYLRENKPNIKYSRKPIIDLGKQTRTYRTSRGKKQAKAKIREYNEWNYGKHLRKNQ